MRYCREMCGTAARCAVLPRDVRFVPHTRIPHTRCILYDTHITLYYRLCVCVGPGMRVTYTRGILYDTYSWPPPRHPRPHIPCHTATTGRARYPSPAGNRTGGRTRLYNLVFVPPTIPTPATCRPQRYSWCWQMHPAKPVMCEWMWRCMCMSGRRHLCQTVRQQNGL